MHTLGLYTANSKKVNEPKHNVLNQKELFSTKPRNMNLQKSKIISLLSLLIIAISCTQNTTNRQSEEQQKTVNEDINHQILVQRATQTAIWAMPAVGMIDFVKATRRDVNGDYNDVIYLSKPFESRHGFLTANDVTAYAWGNIKLEGGPMVVEVPAATDNINYFGTFVNAWDQPIEDVGPRGADKGKGGKYLLVPFDYEGDLPKEDYIIRTVDTYDVGFSFRPKLKNGATDADAAKYAQKLKIYPLADADNPKPTKHIDAYQSNYDCLPYYDHTFFQDINDFIQANPIRPQDKAMVNLLKDFGIVKGQPFNPTEAQKKAMQEGLDLAYASMQSYFTTEGKAMVPLWKGKSQWQVWNFAKGQPQIGFPYETEEEILIDQRAGGSYFWITYLPKYLGADTYYLTGIRDSNGDLFNGKNTYKLTVPNDVPAKDFWSVIVYSMKTKGFVRNMPEIGLATRDEKNMKANEDGSFDVYFGPEAPEGYENNFIPTGGEDFFLLFRLYGPESMNFHKTWTLGDVVKVD